MQIGSLEVGAANINPLGQARKEADLTHRELADKSGVQAKTIQVLEDVPGTGVHECTLGKLAEALNVSVDRLKGLA